LETGDLQVAARRGVLIDPGIGLDLRSARNQQSCDHRSLN
jgi:hypothetical protein